ncbi:MAG: hypothetical protein DWQ34_20890 [Planctomycetota bacterium]|nr:MAG: hypothetical protein DWQ34_20890 [Planctomycetota bacterium]REJ94759.1 MAG: hypothetical protein DWQ29_02710 [Planctomycetota bacterium]REK29215.1 MAG: hypothetical protein DWQ41_04495 [Planctomycetota bacterium]REK29399.1 MAG: hypothetical protein DWQ45_22785 [Planctomycetota bacterium]
MGVVVACVVYLGGQSAPEDNEGRAIAEKFLMQVRTGEVDAAWESTTADFKSDEGRESFRAFVAARPVLSEKAEFVASEETIVHGLTRWKYTYRLGSQGSSAEEIYVLLTNERGEWKVDRFAAE